MEIHIGTAVQNLDYMAHKKQECSRIGVEDPFQISSTNILNFRLMEEANLLPHSRTPEYASLKDCIRDGRKYDNRDNILPGTSRTTYNEREMAMQFLERFAMGILGGLAMIGPVLIMVLHKDLLTSLLTTSVATLLFAGALAIWGKSLGGDTVLALVAAYAAVLVVFIGSSS